MPPPSHTAFRARRSRMRIIHWSKEPTRDRSIKTRARPLDSRVSSMAARRRHSSSLESPAGVRTVVHGSMFSRWITDSSHGVWTRPTARAGGRPPGQNQHWKRQPSAIISDHDNLKNPLDLEWTCVTKGGRGGSVIWKRDKPIKGADLPESDATAQLTTTFLLFPDDTLTRQGTKWRITKVMRSVSTSKMIGDTSLAHRRNHAKIMTTHPS